MTRETLIAKLKQVHAYRQGRRSAKRRRDPIAFVVSDGNASTCEELFRMSPGEVKALLPLKKAKRGATVRYVAVLKQIDRFLESLPDA